MCPTEPKPSAEVQHIDASGDVTLPGALGTDGWREAQQGDEDLQLVMQYVSSASVPSGPERRTLPVMVQQLLRHVSRLTVIDGVLYKRMTDPNTHECPFQIVCPAAKQDEVWWRYHEALAHAGIERTLTRVRYHFFWPKMEEVVRGFHSGCIACSLQNEKNSCKAP